VDLGKNTIAKSKKKDHHQDRPNNSKSPRKRENTSAVLVCLQPLRTGERGKGLGQEDGSETSTWVGQVWVEQVLSDRILSKACDRLSALLRSKGARALVQKLYVSGKFD